MLRKLLASSFVLGSLLFSPLASAALIVSTTPNFSSTGDPDVYDLSDTGQFNSYFYSPFTVGDLAWSGSNQLLVGHHTSGRIATVDGRGGLVNLMYTALNGVDGLASGSNGELYAAERSTNRLFKLSTTGTVLGISFMPQSVTSLGITGNDQLLFSRPSTTSFSSPQEIVFWDFDQGEQSSFVTALSSITGLAVIGNEIFAVGRSSNSFSSPVMINRFDFAGNSLGTINGPSNIESITAHTPEPGTALLLGLGLGFLANRGRALQEA